MNKTLRLKLNRYNPTPLSLREDTAIDRPRPEVTVGLASLYHHYYLDSYGCVPPNPDPAQFEHAQFLLPSLDFRFQGSGLGISPAIKQHRSNELGQAFCRWFLHEHLGLTYFAHIEHLLKRRTASGAPSYAIQRTAAGDTPDYLCASGSGNICLAEAKGRYSSISFKNKEFEAWRQQFSRVVIKDASGAPRIVKGHIIATRFATEDDSDHLKSTIWAEDPNSPGERLLDVDLTPPLEQSVIAAHYSDIASKIRQPVLALSLRNGVPMPDELNVIGVAWRVQTGPLKGRRFIGGYFAVDNIAAIVQNSDGGSRFMPRDLLRLDLPGFTFFGVEENILRQVVVLARRQTKAASKIETFEQTDFFYSGFSVLRDGTAIGPLDFFSPDDIVSL